MLSYLNIFFYSSLFEFCMWSVSIMTEVMIFLYAYRRAYYTVYLKIFLFLLFILSIYYSVNFSLCVSLLIINKMHSYCALDGRMHYKLLRIWISAILYGIFHFVSPPEGGELHFLKKVSVVPDMRRRPATTLPDVDSTLTLFINILPGDYRPGRVTIRFAPPPTSALVQKSIPPRSCIYL